MVTSEGPEAVLTRATPSCSSRAMLGMPALPTSDRGFECSHEFTDGFEIGQAKRKDAIGTRGHVSLTPPNGLGKAGLIIANMFEIKINPCIDDQRHILSPGSLPRRADAVDADLEAAGAPRDEVTRLPD